MHEGLISDEQFKLMQLALPVCENLIKQCKKSILGTIACDFALEVCNVSQVAPYSSTGLNNYDIRIKCDKPPLCYDFSEVENLLNSATVQEKLNVKANSVWQSCNMWTNINLTLSGDWMLS